MDRNDLRTKVFSGFFWKFGERITAQLVTLIVSVVLARVLDPSHYGTVALVMIFITFANVFVSSGLGSALIQKKDADNIDFSSVFYFNLGLSLVLYIILFFIAPLASDFFNDPILTPALRVLGIRIVVASINSVQQAFVSRNMLFRKFFVSTLFGTVTSGIVGIVLAYRGFEVWALIAQYLTNTCIDTIVLWITVRWRPSYVFSWNKTKELISFGWKLLITALIDTGYNQIRSLVIGKRYSSEDLAFYNQAERYPSLFITNINASISSVVFPAMSKAQSDIEKVRQMTRRSIQISSFVIWPLMIELFVTAEPLVSLLLTDKWLPCVPYIRIFCISYAFWPIHTANLQAMNALGRSDLFLKLEIIKKTVGVVALLITIPMGPFAIAVSMLISSILSTFINSYPNIKVLKYGVIEQFKDILPSLLASSIMGVLIWCIHFLLKNNVLLLCLQTIIGGTIYLFIAYIFHMSGMTYLIQLIKGFRKNRETNQ